MQSMRGSIEAVSWAVAQGRPNRLPRHPRRGPIEGNMALIEVGAPYPDTFRGL